MTHTHRIDAHAAPAPFFEQFDHRTLIVVWCIYTVLLVSIDKFDIVKALSFAAFPLFAVIAGDIRITMLLQRLVILSPFIIIMAAANPFLDRTPAFSIGNFTVSTGMLSAAVIVTKAFLSLASMLILDYCISIDGLCTALQRLGVPAVFTTQLLLLHRYIHLIINEAATLMRARDMRCSRKRGKGPLDTANLIGTLLLRTTERSERIYRAMLTRGFDGTLPARRREHFTINDYLFLGCTVTLFAALRFIL